VHDATFGCIERHAPGPLFQPSEIPLQHHLVLYIMYHSVGGAEIAGVDIAAPSSRDGHHGSGHCGSGHCGSDW